MALTMEMLKTFDQWDTFSPDNPVSWTVSENCKLYKTGWVNGLTNQVLLEDLLFLMHIYLGWPNYFSTAVVLIHFMLNVKDLQPSPGTYMIPWNWELVSSYGCAVTDDVKARMMDSVHAMFYTTSYGWVKRVTVPPKLNESPVHVATKEAVLSPNIKKYVDYMLKFEHEVRAKQWLHTALLNPFLDMETVHKILHAFKGEKSFIRQAVLNIDAVPLDEARKLAGDELKKELFHRPDFPADEIQVDTNQATDVYPNSTDRHIRQFICRWARGWMADLISAFMHPNCSDRTRQQILKLCEKRDDGYSHSTLEQLITAQKIPYFQMMTYDLHFPGIMRKILLAENMNKKFKPVVDYLCDRAKRPETFFLQDIDQVKEVAETCESLMRSGS